MDGISVLEGVDQTEENRRDWLALRRRTIGSSEISAIAGFNPWRSPLRVWMEKTGKIEPDSENDAMVIGKLSEPVVAELFRRKQQMKVNVKPSQSFIVHPEYTFASCTPDFWVELLAENEEVVSRRILEVKTAHAMKIDEWENGEAPTGYRLQCLWQLGVTGLPSAYLAALIGGSDYREVTIPHDPDLFSSLITIAQEFMSLVEKDIPPNAGPNDAKIIKKLMKRVAATAVLPDSVVEIAHEYSRLKDQVSDLKQRLETAQDQVKKIENNIRLMMKGHQAAEVEFQTDTGLRRVYIKDVEVKHPGATIAPYEYNRLMLKIEDVKREVSK